MSLKRSWLLKERVVLDQPSEGYRAGLDAVLLAAALRLNKPDERLLEAGCGAGGALFCAASRLSEAHFTGLERDSAMLELVSARARPCALQRPSWPSTVGEAERFR